MLSETPVDAAERCADRCWFFLQRGRFREGSEQARLGLQHEPNHARSHSLLALCLAELGQFEEATSAGRYAIHLSPHWSYAYYTLAFVHHKQDDDSAAADAIGEALRIDPREPAYFSLAASIAYARRDWSATLDHANRGLEIDAEHTRCLNLRALALLKLGRIRRANQTLESAIAQDPELALTHNSQGWAALAQRQPSRAYASFCEALRIDPNLENAQQGMQVARKAYNWVWCLISNYLLLAILAATFMGVVGMTGAMFTNFAWLLIVIPYVGLFLTYREAQKRSMSLPDFFLQIVAVDVPALSHWRIQATHPQAYFLIVFGFMMMLCMGSLCPTQIVAVASALLPISVASIFICHKRMTRWLMTGYNVAVAVWTARTLYICLKMSPHIKSEETASFGLWMLLICGVAAAPWWAAALASAENQLTQD